MNILYGVQGTGNGHITRARVMCEAFRERGVQVDFLFSGRDESKYFSMECFGHYQTRRGLTFVTQQGQVNYVKTAFNNSPAQLWQEIKQLDLSDYDLVLNDFEPVSAWAAKRQGIPCIGISHQNAFRYPVPLKGATWLDKLIMQRFAPADYHLGLHWYHFDQPILPPIVHTADTANVNQDYILVYLPFEQIEQVCEMLFRFVNQHFVFYHPHVIEAELIENVELRPLCHAQFHQHLQCCAGVIANGGFELPSEALSLGKKLLLKPLNGQFEQQSNVATLDILGLASVMDFLDASAVSKWLDEKQAERVVYPNVASAITEWVMKGRWDDHSELCNTLWQQVDFPSYVSTN
ncbi:glycosyltransferase [Vibrio sp. Vb2880]|uniref:MJ1255/VC2487 family glycosyltransferase n=1 Tax=Vibrio sp. Vb2880 TaxID=2816076 RepID=UPI001A8EDEE6|nr:MJ1255/VC2487 family glycosyltransferase [Vibrio sp. Vb2880]MBO0215175.1 glycosyltransferase [Vibrio sp. Vb2880]